jgi:hypothetical protein
MHRLLWNLWLWASSALVAGRVRDSQLDGNETNHLHAGDGVGMHARN